jgi:hypothetical protein
MLTPTMMLDRLLGPLSETLSADDVHRIASLPRDTDVDTRMDELGDKANEGTLTPEERKEYELYIQASEFAAILLAKARRRLRHRQQEA